MAKRLDDVDVQRRADLNCSILGAETTEFGRKFQVLIVLGKKEKEKADTLLRSILFLDGLDRTGILLDIKRKFDVNKTVSD